MKYTKRASPYAQELIDSLAPFLTFESCPAGKQIKFVEDGLGKCFFMREGVVLLYRGYQDAVLIGGFTAPFIGGLGEYHEEISRFRLETTEKCEIAELTREATFEIIEKQNLWKLVAQQMQYVSERLFKYSALISAPSAYEIICNQLRVLMDEPPSLRNSITAEKYIRSKKPLSRSGTMRILAALKTGGYIVLKEGILIEIRRLPAKY